MLVGHKVDKIAGDFFLLLVSMLLAGPVRADGHIQVDHGVVQVSQWQGALPLGKYAYVADVPQSYLKAWFSSSGSVLKDLVKDIPASKPLSSLTGQTDSELKWHRNSGNKLFLNAPSQLSLIAIDLKYTGAGDKNVILDMSMIDGIAWLYRDDQGKWRGYADNFDKLMGGQPIKDTRPFIPMHLIAGHRYRLYIAAYTINATRHAWMDLWNAEELRFERLKLHLLDGIYFGLIIALIIYNLFLFAALRRYPYLFIAFFVAASAGEVSFTSGVTLFFVPYPLILPLIFLFQGAVEVFGALFTMSLMNISTTNRALFHLWNMVIAISIVSTAIIVEMTMARNGGFSPGSINSTIYIAAFVWIAYQAANLLTLINYWSESRVARYWFLGITIHTWSLAIYPMLLDTSANLIIDPYHFAQLATVLDVILLSAVISYSFRWEQDSRLQAQRRSVADLRFALDEQQAKSDFVATVGHDLRGPVQAISFFTDSLKNTLSADAQSGLQKIDENLVSISELLDNLIKLSESERQASHTSLEKVSISQLFAAMKAEFEQKAAEKRISLEFDSTHGMVESDRVCLSQILRNLIDNAIKYTDEGSVTVSVVEEPDTMHITVEDTGRGIPDTALLNIFDEFYQVDGEDADNSGVGLGLSIVARLTKLLGIEVTVRSKHYVGTSFELNIFKDPLEVMGSGPVSAATHVQNETVTLVPHTARGSLSGVSVLIVSDNNPAMDSLRDLLLGWGANFCQLDTIRQGINFLINQNWTPDLVLVDASQYRSLGKTLSQEEVEQLFTDDIPVFVLSGNDDHLLQSDIMRENHIVIRTTIQPMKFRSLIQRHVTTSGTDIWGDDAVRQ